MSSTALFSVFERPDQPNSKTASMEAIAMEARLGLRLAAALDASTRNLPHEISERLHYSRKQAVARLNTKKRIGQRIQALCTSQNTGYINNTVTAHLMSLFQHWKKIISSALPAFGLVIGLFAIHSWQSQELITDIADVDAILLADDLPPEAYKDPGFAEFISKSENIQESFPSSE